MSAVIAVGVAAYLAAIAWALLVLAGRGIAEVDPDDSL